MERALFYEHLIGVHHAVHVSQCAVFVLLIHRCSRGQSQGTQRSLYELDWLDPI